MVVQHRVVSIETIYTQTIKTDLTGSIYICTHTYETNTIKKKGYRLQNGKGWKGFKGEELGRLGEGKKGEII